MITSIHLNYELIFGLSKEYLNMMTFELQIYDLWSHHHTTVPQPKPPQTKVKKVYQRIFLAKSSFNDFKRRWLRLPSTYYVHRYVLSSWLMDAEHISNLPLPKEKSPERTQKTDKANHLFVRSRASEWASEWMRGANEAESFFCRKKSLERLDVGKKAGR